MDTRTDEQAAIALNLTFPAPRTRAGLMNKWALVHFRTLNGHTSGHIRFVSAVGSSDKQIPNLTSVLRNLCV